MSEREGGFIHEEKKDAAAAFSERRWRLKKERKKERKKEEESPSGFPILDVVHNTEFLRQSDFR